MNKLFVLFFLLVPFTWLLFNAKDSDKEIPYQSSSLQKSKAAGEKVYKKYCISCHQADGGGVPRLTPPLINTSYVLGDKETLIKIILNGLKNVDIDEETYSNPMPALGKVLKDQQIADVLTFVRNSFGNKAALVTVADVKIARSNVKK
ncbi:MAG: c-type cytochrome [Ginsengibacter sp.]